MRVETKIPKWVLAAILAVAVIVSCVANAETYRAPVVKAEGTDPIMVQTGWFSYEAQKGILFLYCVDSGHPTLTCTVYVVTDKGVAGVALVDGIIPTEGRY